MANNKLASIKIQVLERAGYWRDVGSTMNSDQLIQTAMATAYRSYGGKKVRAVDRDGNVVDIKQ